MVKARWLGPVLLASSIIVSTAVASFTWDSRLVLVGPLVMAVGLIAVGVLQHRVHGAPRARIWAAVIMGGAIVVAAVIVARRDPARVASLLPVLGGALAVFIVGIPSRGGPSDRDVERPDTSLTH